MQQPVSHTDFFFPLPLPLKSIISERNTLIRVEVRVAGFGLTAEDLWDNHCPGHFFNHSTQPAERKDFQDGSHAHPAWT